MYIGLKTPYPPQVTDLSPLIRTLDEEQYRCMWEASYGYWPTAVDQTVHYGKLHDGDTQVRGTRQGLHHQEIEDSMTIMNISDAL